MIGAAVAPSADAQVRMRSSETRELRDAANRESRGDFAGAEAVLRGLLADTPNSSGALFALERVLRAQGQEEDLLPVVDRFLEVDPTSSGVRFLKLRLLTDSGDLDAVRSEAEAWIRTDPQAEGPYREVARIYERAFGTEEALELLAEGRSAIGTDDALALETGDLYAARGNWERAVDEWAAALGEDGSQTVTILRRVQGLGDESTRAGRRMVSALTESDQLVRRRAATRIALDLGLEAEALEVATGIEGQLDGRTRVTFLSDVARRAREQDLVTVASWAYDALGEDAASPTERRQFDQRIVDVALASGDTATALEAQLRVAASYSARSVDRRRATAEAIRLEAQSADPERLQSLLADFRAEYPGAPELDALAASISGALHARGDPSGAGAVLEGVEGPQSLLERGYLLLGDGNVEEGRGALLLAITGLPPSEATPVIQFASLLGRVSPDAALLVADAGVEARRGRGVAAAGSLASAVAELPDEDQPPVLAEAARLAAAAGDADMAASIHERVIAQHGDAPEAGEAALSLAQFHARTSRGVPQAIRLLEQLITNRPNAAVAPHARLELERLRGRGR